MTPTRPSNHDDEFGALVVTVGQPLFAQRSIWKMRPDPIPVEYLRVVVAAASKAPNGGTAVCAGQARTHPHLHHRNGRPMTADPGERERIRAAMDRILAGSPERSNGELTVVALAIEADVPPNALTQRHTDLKNEFYLRIKGVGAQNGDEAGCVGWRRRPASVGGRLQGTRRGSL